MENIIGEIRYNHGKSWIYIARLFIKRLTYRNKSLIIILFFTKLAKKFFQHILRVNGKFVYIIVRHSKNISDKYKKKNLFCLAAVKVIFH